MNTTQPKTPEDIKFMNDLESLDSNYSRKKAELMMNCEQEKFEENNQLLETWYENEKKKLQVRSAMRDGVDQVEEVVENTKNDLWNAWQTLKRNFNNFFSKSHDSENIEMDNSIAGDSQMWEEEADCVRYLEDIKNNIEWEKIKQVVHNEMQEIDNGNENSKYWMQEAEDVFYLEKIKNEIEQMSNIPKRDTSQCKENFMNIPTMNENGLLNSK